MRLRSCSRWACAWAWACCAAAAASIHVPTPPPGLAEDAVRWQYDDRPPASQGRIRAGAGAEADDCPELEAAAGVEKGGGAGAGAGHRAAERPDPIELTRAVGSSVRLPIAATPLTRKVTWRFVTHGSSQTILQYSSYSDIVSFNAYFRQRVRFQLDSGSLTLKAAGLEDTGLFEAELGDNTAGSTIEYRAVAFLLDVQPRLRTPRVAQTAADAADTVALSCSAAGHAGRAVWQRDGERLANSSRVQLQPRPGGGGGGGTTLLIRGLTVADCGLYTCTVSNAVSASSNSLFLAPAGLFVGLLYTLPLSAAGLVGAAASSAAAAFVFFVALRHPVARTHQQQLAAALVTLQLAASACLLLASLLSLSDSGLSAWYRGVAGLGCCWALTMAIYVSVLLLGQAPAFLSHKLHRGLILASGPVSVLPLAAVVHKATEIAVRCRCRYEVLVVRSVLAVLVYMFAVGLFVLFYTVYVLQPYELRQKLQKVKRAPHRRAVL